MTLGQWAAVLEGWSKAHSREEDTPSAPSADEFETAVLRARDH